MDLKVLHRQGVSIRQLARQTGLSRTTVRRLLGQVAPKQYGPRARRAPKIGAYVTRLDELLAQRPRAHATWLYDAIHREGYEGHYEQVKRWVRARRREESARRRACVRFETGPGVESQFDWKGPVRGLIDGAPDLEVHFFRFMLAWSRARWTLVVTSLALPAVLAALRWGFERAGGVTERVVLDNPKTAVMRPKPRLELHPFFADFCRHQGCEPDPAWPYYPERKGKTERSLQDLEGAGILDTKYPSLAALQSAVSAVDEARMACVHATTGEVPSERLVRERAVLSPLPAIAFDPRIPETRRVLTDCTVSFLGSFYSVPFAHVGSRVVVKVDPLGDAIEIFAGADRVAEHVRVPKGPRSVHEEHVAALRRPRFERMRDRARAAPKRVTPGADLLSVVPWPRIAVEQRPIEEYAALAGGVR